MLDQAVAGMVAGSMLSWLALLLGLVGLVAVGIVWRLLGKSNRRDVAGKPRPRLR